MFNKLREKLSSKEVKKEESKEEKSTKKEEQANTTTKTTKKNKVKTITKEEEIKSASPMGKLLSQMKNPPSIGDLVEGPVIAIEKSSVYVDLTPFGTGIIYGREFITTRDVIKKINIGDIVAAKIIDNSHKEGYYELSLKEARQALIWSEAETAIKENVSSN